MLEILNLPPQAMPPQTCLNEKMAHTHTHTHTHTTHTHTHHMHTHTPGSQKGTICNPSQITLCSRHHIMTYHESVLRYHTKISIQSSSE